MAVNSIFGQLGQVDNNAANNISRAATESERLQKEWQKVIGVLDKTSTGIPGHLLSLRCDGDEDRIG